MGDSAQSVSSDMAIELVPGSLYRLGGVAAIEDDISWIPKGATGFLPLNCFLLVDGDQSLLVDTGVPLNAREIAAQLRRILPGDPPLHVFFTRFEQDTLGNMPMLSTEFTIGKISGGGISNPFDYFDDLSSQEQLKADYQIELTRVMPGDSVRISDTRKLDLVVTTIRLLTTFWAYDAATKTLFTSDSFGHAYLDNPDEPAVLTSDNDSTTFEQVRDHALTKFDWLKGAETDVLNDDLTKIFDSYDVEIIAPDCGRVLQGRDVVERHVAMFKKVLTDIRN